MSPTVRTLFAGLILATCASYGGCWDWSAPDELLGRADGPPILKQDAASDGPLDAASPDSDLQPLDLPLPSEAGVDTNPPPDGATKPCAPACFGKKPICEAGVCRACMAHTECANELCALDGSCPASSAITYVDDGCSGSQDGSKANPFCKIDDAVDKNPHYILVRKGSYGPTTIDSSHEVHGEPGAEIVSSSCPALTIDGATATAAGLVIKGGVSIKGAATATLEANSIGPSTNCAGVVSAAGTKVVLRRNYVHDNTPGGVFLEAVYTVENNIIANNGNVSVNWGGVKLKPSGISTFNNNTVADNTSKGANEKEAGGVRCEAAAALVNNIFWGNTSSATKTPTDARQYSVACTATHCLEELPSGASPTGTNISGDPKFVGTSGAAGYHIKPASPARDKGLKGAAPAVDYDNQQRDKTPDIGADEVVP